MANLNLPQVAPNRNQKEVMINDQADALDRALLTLILPVLLLSACASKSPSYNVVPAIPPLLAEAKVSQVPTPSVCSPNCTTGWSKMVGQSADTLTGSE